MIPAEKLDQKMQELWRKHRSASLARLEVVERAVEAANKGTLTEELRALATREAHKLAGSLGTFGMAFGSAIAGEIEDFFSSYGSAPAQKGSAEIHHRFDRLRREIENR